MSGALVLKTAFYIGLMIGAYYVLRWIIYGFNAEFGEGLITGMVVMIVLIWLAFKADPKSFYR